MKANQVISFSVKQLFEKYMQNNVLTIMLSHLKHERKNALLQYLLKAVCRCLQT